MQYHVYRQHVHWLSRSFNNEREARQGWGSGGSGRQGGQCVVLRWRPVLSRFPSRVQYKKIEKGCEKSDIMYSV